MTREEINDLDEIETHLRLANPHFKGSNTWANSSAVGKVIWLIENLQTREHQLAQAYIMLDEANEKISKHKMLSCP